MPLQAGEIQIGGFELQDPTDGRSQSDWDRLPVTESGYQADRRREHRLSGGAVRNQGNRTRSNVATSC